MSRIFTKQQRSILYQKANGRCTLCNKAISFNEMHADHIYPWSKGGRTDISNGQALCPKCNLSKGNNTNPKGSIMLNLRTCKAMNNIEIKSKFPMLRKHQVSALELAFRQRDGLSGKHTLIEVTPGGGKSALPSIFTHIVRPKYPGMKMMWVVPRKSLQEQGSDSVNLGGEYSMREVLKTNLTIREGSNQFGSAAGVDGYTITYQSINRGVQYHIDEMNEAPFALFLDECHHIKENVAPDNEGEDAGQEVIAQLINHKNCKFVYYMTGTAERHDQQKLAFIPYNNKNEIEFNHPDWNYIKYNRADAIEEQAKLELTFAISDAQGEYIDKDGTVTSFTSLKTSNDELDSRTKLKTALLTDFSEILIDRSISELRKQRKENERAQLIILAASQKIAKRYVEYIKDNTPYIPALATSDEKNAQTAIRNFRYGRVTILVTVGMAHEGLDAPGVSIITALTNYRSKPWLEQAFDRATRINYKIPQNFLQTATIFAPADDAMLEIIEMISKEQRVDVNIREDIITDVREPNADSEPINNEYEAIDSDVVDTTISSELEDITVDEYEAMWMMEKYAVAMSQVIFFKKHLLEAGEYTYPGFRAPIYNVEDVKRVIRLYGSVLQGELMSDARSAAIRCGASAFDTDAQFKKLQEAFIANGVESNKITMIEITKIRKILNEDCLEEERASA